MQSVLNYATHICTDPERGLLGTVVLELLVDRSRGSTIHSQWVQEEPESVLITGAYLHLFLMAQYDAPGFRGWYRIHEQAFEKMRRYDEDNSATDMSEA